MHKLFISMISLFLSLVSMQSFAGDFGPYDLICRSQVLFGGEGFLVTLEHYRAYAGTARYETDLRAVLYKTNLSEDVELDFFQVGKEPAVSSNPSSKLVYWGLDFYLEVYVNRPHLGEEIRAYFRAEADGEDYSDNLLCEIQN